MRAALASVLLVATAALTGCRTPAVRANSCQTGNATETATGAQPRWERPLPADTTLNGFAALWIGTDPYPMTLLGPESGACVVGGSIFGTWSSSDSWSRWHDRAALRFSQPNFMVYATNIETTGDGIKPRDGDGGTAQDFTIFGNRVTHAHDDCIENDYLHAGTIADNLLDGCYVVFSARPSSRGVDGTRNVVTIADNIVALEPMQSVYKGPSPGHGGFFKWGDRAPRVALTGNILLVRQVPNHGTLDPPPGLVRCSGNVVVWLGPGAFPSEAAWRSQCPDTRITTNRAVYDNARAAWNSSHRVGA